jgi:zinc transport system substrate-binding protein
MSQLDSLDAEIRSELSVCEKKEFISFHNAFSYLAHRHNLTQLGIHETISPAGEILPQRIQKVIEIARNKGIDTIYSEDLLDPRLANIIAQEVPNGKVLILSPLEGIDNRNKKQVSDMSTRCMRIFKISKLVFKQKIANVSTKLF